MTQKTNSMLGVVSACVHLFCFYDSRKSLTFTVSLNTFIGLIFAAYLEQMVEHSGSIHLFQDYSEMSLQAKAAVNYSKRGLNCHHKETTSYVGGTGFYTLSKQTPKQTVNVTNGPSLPLFLGALVRSFDFGLGGWDAAKATFATGGHVRDVLKAVVQWARSRGL